jgi:hypothetical protein
METTSRLIRPQTTVISVLATTNGNGIFPNPLYWGYQQDMIGRLAVSIESLSSQDVVYSPVDGQSGVPLVTQPTFNSCSLNLNRTKGRFLPGDFFKSYPLPKLRRMQHIFGVGMSCQGPSRFILEPVEISWKDSWIDVPAGVVAVANTTYCFLLVVHWYFPNQIDDSFYELKKLAK